MKNEREIRFAGIGENFAVERPSAPAEHSLGVVPRRGPEQLFLDHFGLNEQPFGVTPDMRFLYLGAKHRQALDTLSYGTELNRGFLTLVARPGMGKTSLLFQYLESLRDKARTVFLFQTDCDSSGLLRYLLAELGIDGKGMDLPEMRSVLNRVLLGEMEAGRKFVLVIDEAQNLDEKVLESVRLLSNFETPWMKLMHIVLAGQPQLGERLAKPSMAQLRQRVAFAIQIEPFTLEETNLYIDHRLWVAGHKSSPLFSMGARALIAEHSEGIPRNINNLCFCAMSFACAMKQKSVDRQMMSEVLADLDTIRPSDRSGEAAAKFAEEPRLNAEPSPNPQPTIGQSMLAQPKSAQAPAASLTLTPPPSRRWFGGLVLLAAFAAFGLGWYGLQYRVDKRVGAFVDEVLALVRHAPPEPVPPAPAAPTAKSQSELPLAPKAADTPGADSGPRPAQESLIPASGTAHP